MSRRLQGTPGKRRERRGWQVISDEEEEQGNEESEMREEQQPRKRKRIRIVEEANEDEEGKRAKPKEEEEEEDETTQRHARWIKRQQQQRAALRIRNESDEEEDEYKNENEDENEARGQKHPGWLKRMRTKRRALRLSDEENEESTEPPPPQTMISETEADSTRGKEEVSEDEAEKTEEEEEEEEEEEQDLAEFLEYKNIARAARQRRVGPIPERVVRHRRRREESEEERQGDEWSIRPALSRKALVREQQRHPKRRRRKVEQAEIILRSSETIGNLIQSRFLSSVQGQVVSYWKGYFPMAWAHLAATMEQEEREESEESQGSSSVHYPSNESILLLRVETHGYRDFVVDPTSLNVPQLVSMILQAQQRGKNTSSFTSGFTIESKANRAMPMCLSSRSALLRRSWVSICSSLTDARLNCCSLRLFWKHTSSRFWQQSIASFHVSPRCVSM